VQRVLAAHNPNHARRGTIFAGYLKILPIFIFVIPGVIAYALAQQNRLQLAAPDQALPTLVAALLPVGVRGLVVAGLLAALMSSLSAVFNSTSTLITLDVYKRFQPAASERHLVTIGQVSTALLVGFGLLWIPIMKLISGQLYQYLQSVQAYISPPIAAVFLIGVLWKRVNATGAMAALITGFVLGMGRLVVEVTRPLQRGPLEVYAQINFLHFAVFLFVVCTVVLAIVSLLTPAPPASKVDGLTFGALAPAPAAETNRRWRRADLLMSLLLVVGVALVWIYFS
jgi:SSS family solute:Na+ symporter